MEVGTWADWVSGTGSWLAVVVALGATLIANNQRKQDLALAERLRQSERDEAVAADNERKQGYVHQISFKLSTLASEAVMTKKDLNPTGVPDDQLVMVTDPFEIVGSFSPNVGYDDTMVRDLAEQEQNLLMLLKENDFLMDFSECLARNQSIRRGLLEYKAKREAVLSMLPPPEMVNGQVISHMLTMQEKVALSPWIVPLGTIVISLRQLAKLNVEMLTRLCQEHRPMMLKHYPELNIHSIEMGQ